MFRFSLDCFVSLYRRFGPASPKTQIKPQVYLLLGCWLWESPARARSLP